MIVLSARRPTTRSRESFHQECGPDDSVFGRICGRQPVPYCHCLDPPLLSYPAIGHALRESDEYVSLPGSQPSGFGRYGRPASCIPANTLRITAAGTKSSPWNTPLTDDGSRSLSASFWRYPAGMSSSSGDAISMTNLVSGAGFTTTQPIALRESRAYRRIREWQWEYKRRHVEPCASIAKPILRVVSVPASSTTPSQ